MENDSQCEPSQASTAEPSELITVKVIFDYKQERWSHDFRVAKGSSVIDLKQSMVDPSSPPDDRISFDLLHQRLRLSNLDTLDDDETLEFRFLGEEEGRRLFQKDKDVRAREEEAQRRSREAEQQRQEVERLRREELARQREEEEQRRKEREAEASPEAAEVSAAPVPPPQAAAKPSAPKAPPPEAKQEEMSWTWTQKGVDAVASNPWDYGYPEPHTAFTDEHLRQVQMLSPGNLNHASLSRDGFISFGKVRERTQPVQHRAGPAAQAQKPPDASVSVAVTHKDSGQSVTLSLPPGQTIFDLKKALSSHVNRGPSSKLTLMYKTGKLLGDSAKLDALSPEDRGGLLASGLELGPPVVVTFTVYHAAKTSTGTTVALEVLDTATFQEVKKALCDTYGAKLTEVRLVTKKPGTTGFVGCKDSDRIQGLREIGASGKLMDRVASGEAKPVPTAPGSISVEVVHAKNGSTVVLQVLPDATMLQLRQAIMKAIGQTKMSEVQLVKADGSELVDFEDSESLNGRKEVMMLGCDLPNPP